MLENTTNIKVRYAETDQMGIVNNAIYPIWFEIGRTELFDELQLPYSEMEKQGIMLPLSELHVKYHSPAYYGQTVNITTKVKEMPGVRITFDYEITHKGILIATGQSTQAFVNAATLRPMRIPKELKESLQKYFN